MHNGLKTQEALEGTFSRTGFLLVGTDESPCPYMSAEPRRDAHGGKQFGIAQTRTGRHPADFFDPHFKPLFEGDVWAERLPYRELQPDKPPPGFLTSDYSKRDEFSLSSRMEQFREQVKHESRVLKAAEARLVVRRAAAVGGERAAPTGGSAHRRAPLLFDMVFNSDAGLCQKVRRDTVNPTLLGTERRAGPMKSTTQLAHTAPGAATLPQFGHKRASDAC